MSLSATYSQIVTIIYGAVYGLAVIVVTIVAMCDLSKAVRRRKYSKQESSDEEEDHDELEMVIKKDMAQEDHIDRLIVESKIKIDSTKGRLKFLFKSIWSKKAMYFAMAVHTFDTATDFGVLVEFWEMAEVEGSEHENGLNISLLFYLSIASLVVYRIVSAMLLYLMTKSWKKVFVQLLDFEIFETILINWRLQRTTPCDPQIFLQKLEAVFEAAPQSFLQIYYLWLIQGTKAANEGNPELVIVSLIFSLLSLSSRFIKDDAKAFQTKSKLIWLFRRIWRVLDVTHTLCMFGVIWVALGGIVLSAYLGLQIVLFTFVAYWTAHWGFVQFLVSIPIFPDYANTTLGFGCYKYLVHIIILIVCNEFAKYDVKVSEDSVSNALIFEQTFGFFIFIYCWISSCVCMFIFCVIVMIMDPSQTTERDLYSLLLSRDGPKFDELVAFGLNFKIDFDKLQEEVVLKSMVHVIKTSTNRRSAVEYILHHAKYEEMMILSKRGEYKYGLLTVILRKTKTTPDEKDTYEKEEILEITRDIFEYSPSDIDISTEGLSVNGRVKKSVTLWRLLKEEFIKDHQEFVIKYLYLLLAHPKVCGVDSFIKYPHYFEHKQNDENREGNLLIKLCDFVPIAYRIVPVMFKKIADEIDLAISPKRNFWMCLLLKDRKPNESQTAPIYQHQQLSVLFKILSNKRVVNVRQSILQKDKLWNNDLLQHMMRSIDDNGSVSNINQIMQYGVRDYPNDEFIDLLLITQHPTNGNTIFHSLCRLANPRVCAMIETLLIATNEAIDVAVLNKNGETLFMSLFGDNGAPDHVKNEIVLTVLKSEKVENLEKCILAKRPLIEKVIDDEQNVDVAVVEEEEEEEKKQNDDDVVQWNVGCTILHFCAETDNKELMSGLLKHVSLKDEKYKEIYNEVISVANKKGFTEFAAICE